MSMRSDLGNVRGFRLGTPLMPFVDLPFRLKPVCQIVSEFAIAMLPKLMRPLGNLFLATQVLVHMKNRPAFLLVLRLFHKFFLGYRCSLKFRGSMIGGVASSCRPPRYCYRRGRKPSRPINGHQNASPP